MEDNIVREETPTWFKVVAVLAIIWNFIGLVAFFIQLKMSEETLAAMPAFERALYENMPLYATIGFALAVFAGTFASVGLFLRKRWSNPVYFLSLVGIILYQTYLFFVSDIMYEMKASSLVMPIMVLLIGVLLLFYSKRMSKQGWLS